MKNDSKEVNIGIFELTQPVARISDPCYDKSTWCAGTVDNCQTGTWGAVVHHFDEGSWGTRCGYLIASINTFGTPSPYDSRWERLDIDVGVDAGMAGIFDDKYFKDDNSIKGVKRIAPPDESIICADEPWYSICCDRSFSTVGAGCIPYGCNSSSGYGDGSYRASKIEKDGKVVAIMIDFGLDCDDEDEGIDCCGCMRIFDADELNNDGLCPDCEEKFANEDEDEEELVD